MKKFFSMLTAAIFMFSMSFTAFAGTGGFEISGFVDASFFADDNDDSNSFSFDQAEIDITKEIKDWASLRFDLEHTDSGGAIEQGYLTLTAPFGNGVTFTFGKFNAPIGFELLDAPDMYQYSHAIVFVKGLPTNLTGGMLSTTFSDMLDVSLYLVNGWDNNSDTNKNKTIGGRIGVTPMEGINFGLSLISGDDSDVAGENVTVFDIDGTITTIPNLTIGLELNFGTEDKDSAVTNGNDADWFGFLLMGHYDYSEWGGVTLRYDYFDDEDGGRLDRAAASSATSDTRQAITISPTFVIGEGFGALIEYRHDFSDKDVFEKSGTTTVADSNDTFAFEMTYAF